MAIRVDTSADITFGIMSAAVTVTHIRFRRGSDDGQPVVYQLPSAVSVAANEGLRIPSGSWDIVYKSGPLSDAHIRALVEGYWDGTEMEIDAMTSSSTVVSDSGYSQQSYSAWVFTQESD